jgi:hypothetical protein
VVKKTADPPGKGCKIFFSVPVRQTDMNDSMDISFPTRPASGAARGYLVWYSLMMPIIFTSSSGGSLPLYL